MLPSFSAPLPVPSLPGPSALAVGDFNGDGRPDLAVVDQGSFDPSTGKFSEPDVSILLGKGDGTFQAPLSISAGPGPFALEVGDFNGDGKQDLAVLDAGTFDFTTGTFTGGGVSILLGNGDGTFQAPLLTSAGADPLALAVGDFNGDGKQDLAVLDAGTINFTTGTSSGAGVSVLLGKGDGTFQAPLFANAGSGPSALAVGDFTGDGRPDLAVIDQGSFDLATGGFSGAGVSILRGNGDGTFQAPLSISAGVNPAALAVGDFNGDGKPDLAVVDRGFADPTTGTLSGAGVSVLLGKGDGTFQDPVLTSAGAGPSALAVGDFTGDSRPDLAVVDQGVFDPTTFTTSGAGVSILFNQGNGNFQEGAVHNAGGRVFSIAAADLNGDGRADLEVVNSDPVSNTPTVSVLLNQFTASHFALDAPTRTTPNTPISFTVTALTGGNLPATQYTGTIHFTSTDPTTDLPGDYTFTSADQGKHSFTLNLVEPLGETITVTDVADGFSASSTITIIPGETLTTAAPISFTNNTAHTLGIIGPGTEVNLYAVSLAAGDTVTVEVNTQPYGGGLDSYLRVFNGSGAQIASNDNFYGRDADLTFQAPADGTYYVEVSASGNTTYDPQVAGSGQPGPTQGLFDLNLRNTNAPLLPDLVGASFHVVGGPFFWGDTVQVNYTIENRGGADAGPFNVDLRLSTDNLIDSDPSDPLLASFSVPGLAAGASTGGTLTVTLPGEPGKAPEGFPEFGQAFLGFVIDPDNAVPENPLGDNGIQLQGMNLDALDLIAFRSGSGSNHSLNTALPIPEESFTVGTLVPGKEDWYQIDLTQAGRVIAEVNAGGVATRLSLFDASGDLLAQSDGQSPTNPADLIDQYLEASSRGTPFFLKVQDLAGMTASYTLTISCRRSRA